MTTKKAIVGFLMNSEGLRSYFRVRRMNEANIGTRGKILADDIVG
jgi:hypothetical protein